MILFILHIEFFDPIKEIKVKANQMVLIKHVEPIKLVNYAVHYRIKWNKPENG
jgi:hypothetical protein